MALAEHPRSSWSILLIGLVFGPIILMLWLGRGLLALGYLAAGIPIGLILLWAEQHGIIPSMPLFLNFTPASLMATACLNTTGVVHASRIRETSLNRPWYRWLALAPIVFMAVALPMRVFLLHPFSVPSLSGHPNLVVGDYFFVNKLAYGYSRYSFPFGIVQFSGRVFGRHPQRGEIAVFKLPADDSIDYVKRVIGLPGDRIQMRGGRLYINGSEVARQPVSLPDQYRLEPAMTFYRETLPEGASYVIAEYRDDGPADNTDEYVVPDGYYFVLGDNRDNSEDSRFLDRVGYIPEGNFIGPLAFRFWSAPGFPASTRPAEEHPKQQ